MRGALAGVAGTAAHSAVMTTARLTGLLPGAAPPRRTMARALAKATGRKPSRPLLEITWRLGHYAYGAVFGALFSAAHLPRRSAPAYSLGIWLASYGLALPALGLHEHLARDDRRRQATMVLAHLAYGGVLGLLAGGVTSLRAPGTPVRSARAPAPCG